MTAAEEVPVNTRRPLLTGLKLGLVWGLIFAFVESTCSLLSFIKWAKAEGLFPAVKVEIYSISIWVPAVLFLSLLISCVFLIKDVLKPHGRASGRQEDVITGVMTCLLFFMLLETIAPPAKVFELFRQAAIFLIVGLASGAGAIFITGLWRKKPGFSSVASPLLILVLGAFAINHLMLAFFLNIKLRDYPLVFAVAAFGTAGIIFLILGWRCFLSGGKARRMAWSAMCLIFLLSPLISHEWEKPAEAKGPPPKNPINIIIIISDACRADSIGAYGGENPTPNIDRLAREGVTFKRALTQAPWTMPSMLSLISSRYPSVLRKYRLFRLHEPITTLTEALRSSGYFTRLLMGNYSLGRSSGFTQGFEEYEVFNEFYRLQGVQELKMLYKMDYLFRRFTDLPVLTDLTCLISEKAGKFLDSDNLPQPFFLLVHFMDPHTPYNPPEKFLAKKFTKQINVPFIPKNPWHIKGDLLDPQEDDIRAGMLTLTPEDKAFLRYLHNAEVRYVDEKVGRLMEKLKERGLEKSTLVVFTSDHGEEFWDHGDYGHGQSVYNELLHVPLMIRGPGLKTRSIDTPVAMIDLAPTLLDIAGIPPQKDFQGKSFLDLAEGKTHEPENIYSEATWYFEEMKAVQDGSHKLIWRQESGLYELYDLEHDPDEAENIYNPGNPYFIRLERDLWPWADGNLRLRKEITGWDAPAGGMEEMENRLKALGYLK